MKILFIITSSIAAIKCKKILKLLKNKKIYVDCIITENVKKIINYNDLKDVIDGKIYSDKSEKNNTMLHIKLTRESDLIVLCPATANTIAKYSKGYCDNLASTALLASNKQTVIIPAMNSQMWNNSINQQNIRKLIDIGVEFIGPVYGKLSCGETGLGRLANLNAILETLPIPKPIQKQRCDELLEQFHLEHKRKQLAKTCSGGERRRLEIARALIMRPKLILLDEPFAAVDPHTVEDVQKEVRKLTEQGISILVTDHAVQQTLHICDRAYIIDSGKNLMDGDPKTIINDELVKKRYLASTFRGDEFDE